MPLTIDCDFPGGNILVTAIDGDEIVVRQDPRDTPIWWFYWAFRLSGAAGRTVRVTFTDGDVFAAHGPCVSIDGVTWQWLGREAVEGTSFRYTFPPTQDAAFFSFCIPYTDRDLRAFLKTYAYVKRQVLCVSEAGRPVERLYLRSTRGTCKVLLTARHHACESMANYEMEGIMTYWGAHEKEAAFLREHVDFHLIPFMDKDGVERGDQGKQREPHDHNRDYTAQPLYASVRALTGQAPAWRGQFALMIDLHCPWIRDWLNEDVLVVDPKGVDTAALDRFLALLDGAQTGPIRYNRVRLRYGEDWNVDTNTSTNYFANGGGAGLVFNIEFPYARAGGVTVTADNARQFGYDLARVIGRYLQSQVPE